MAVLLAASMLSCGCGAMMTSGIGSPFGRSARVGEYVATLISTQEPYVPSLHRNPENDRFRIGLLLHPVDGGAPLRLIPIASGLRHSDYRNSARVLGWDGRHVWFVGQDIGAYDLRARRLVRLEDLRRANRGLDGLWQNARYGFGRRLQITSHDYRQEYEVEPETLRAAPAVGLRRPSGLEAIRATLGGPAADQYRRRPGPIEGVERVTALRNKAGLDSTIALRRVDASGKEMWTVETGIADLDQVLPDARQIALVGRRVAVPNKVQEPVLAIVDVETGRLAAHSLWQR
ncbi:MAG: hypothetical protein JNK48_06600 [Bryobacterales bacterium]|nr:hypothetical protein [Bryobacterales bacterium]